MKLVWVPIRRGSDADVVCILRQVYEHRVLHDSGSMPLTTWSGEDMAVSQVVERCGSTSLFVLGAAMLKPL